MKNILVILIFFITNSYVISAQNNPELKKIWLDKMPNTYDQIKDLDTIFILYYKSDEKGLEQNVNDVKNSTNRSYYFFNHHYFPLEIYDNVGYDKVNFRESIIMYKRKSYITKNLKKTIDVHFLKKYSYDIYAAFYNKKRITFIVDLDAKRNNKYKIL